MRIGARRVLLRPRNKVFSPSDLGNLQVQLESRAGVFEESTFITPSVDLAVAGGWQDQSGKGNHVIQAVTAKKLTYHLAGPNGQPQLQGDGTDDILEGTFTKSTRMSVYCVASILVFACCDVLFDISPNFNAGIAISGGGAIRYTTPEQITGNSGSAFFLYSLIYNSLSSLDIYVDGGFIANINPDDRYQDTTTLSIMGGGSATGRNISGKIAALLAYNSAHTDTQRSLVQTYLANLYGITLP